MKFLKILIHYKKPNIEAKNSAVYIFRDSEAIDKISNFDLALTGKHPWVTCATAIYQKLPRNARSEFDIGRTIFGYLIGTRNGAIWFKVGKKLESDKDYVDRYDAGERHNAHKYMQAKFYLAHGQGGLKIHLFNKYFKICYLNDFFFEF